MKELNEMELKEVEGGNPILVVIAVVGFVISVTGEIQYLYDHWDRVKQGWEDGKEVVNNLIL